MNPIKDTIFQAVNWSQNPVLSQLPVLSSGVAADVLTKGIAESWTLDQMTKTLFSSLPQNKQTPEVKAELGQFVQNVIKQIQTNSQQVATSKKPKEQYFVRDYSKPKDPNEFGGELRFSVLESEDDQTKLKFATANVKAIFSPTGGELEAQGCLLKMDLGVNENHSWQIRGLCGEASAQIGLVGSSEKGGHNSYGSGFEMGGELFSVGHTYSTSADANGCHYEIKSEIDVLGMGGGASVDTAGFEVKVEGPIGFGLDVHQVCETP